MEKLTIMPTQVSVENLQFHQEGNKYITFNKHITGTITIDFTSSGDFSKFISVDNNDKVTINGLSEIVARSIIEKQFEL